MWVNDEKMGFVQCNQHLIVASLIYVPVGNLKMREENQAWKLIIRRRNKKCNTPYPRTEVYERLSLIPPFNQGTLELIR